MGFTLQIFSEASLTKAAFDNIHRRKFGNLALCFFQLSLGFIKVKSGTSVFPNKMTHMVMTGEPKTYFVFCTCVKNFPLVKVLSSFPYKK